MVRGERRWLAAPVARLLVILTIIVLADVLVAAVVSARHKDALPTLPKFSAANTTTPSMRSGIDVYGPTPRAYSLTTAVSYPYSVNDRGGVVLVRDGVERLDPDASLSFALASSARYTKTKNPTDLQRSRRAVTAVLKTRNDGLVGHKTPGESLTGQALPQDWVSGRTQGLLLSAVSRLYSITKAGHWRAEADNVFDSLLRTNGALDKKGRPYSPWISTVDDGGFLWFETYPQSPKPSFVMAGHLSAAIGIYDYTAISTGARRLAANTVFAAAVDTTRRYVPLLRSENAASWTSPDRVERSWMLHQVLVAQLSAVAGITGDATLRRAATDFRSDTAIAAFDTTVFSLKGGVDAYRWPLDAALPPTGVAPPPGDRAGSERNARTSSKPDAVIARVLQLLAKGRPEGNEQPVAQAEVLLQTLLRTTDNGLVPHNFDAVNAAGQELVRPWYSAQTQGLLLSALVRLHLATGEQQWADAAEAAYATLTLARANQRYNLVEPPPVWTSYVGDNTIATNLWFEKYSRVKLGGPYDYPSMVVDAHTTALIGIYDYWNMTNDPRAARLIDGGATALMSRLPDIRRPGSVSESALGWGVHELEHHRVVTRHLTLLAQMTGDRRFSSFAERFATDAP